MGDPKPNPLVQYLLIDKYWKQYLVIFGLILSISILFPQGKSLKYSYQLNDITREPIIAPFTFSILKSEDRLKEDLENQKKSVPFTFNRKDEIVEKHTASLNEFFAMANELRHLSWRLKESKQLVYERRYHKQYEKAKSELVSDSTNLSILTQEFHRMYSFTQNKPEWIYYVTPEQDPKNMKDLERNKIRIVQICKNRWTEGIYNIAISDIESHQVTINQSDVPDLASPTSFNDLQVAWTKARKELLAVFLEGDVFRDLGYDLIVEFMKPNLLFNREITERRQLESLNMVPISQGVVLKNELIVDANIRITEDVLQKLNSLSVAVTKHETNSGWVKIAWSFLGRIILLSVVVSLFFAFLVVYRVTIFRDWKLVSLISIVFLIQLGLAHIFVIRLEWSEYLIPVTVGAMTLTILFDARIGFMATTSMALMMGLMMGQNIDLVIVSLFTSTIAVYNIRELRKRTQLFTTMFALIAASIFVVLGLGLFKEHNWINMLTDIQLLTINSILAPIVTYGMIGLFEILFEVTTDLTLIELLDYDHPLLKRAQQETNGTFNHSIVVGNLAESCANAINAHSLLCRVGAYYHDIGKMEKSEYFIENQYGGANKHDTITHTMSAKIIRAHVKEGLELAEEYALPKLVSDFIPMHHGTTRVEYFYRMALKDAEETGATVDESAFRYPGPKPNTKETGILMICEAVEAAVRSIKEPDIFKIEAMIDKIIKSRIDDGQMSECPITLDELNKIKGTVDGTTGMLPVLRGIYHIRIEYPDDPKSTASA
ncbi:MAG: HDIG domain-containing protein [Candidatus Marinimicrobia bacterium]|nr:HDIG domain-containing protein [Candidatus Neomarinimicrobiota bacterium]MBT5749078.1 HDIG domain-containing protein [Candidatus Neomarinimicrobiota bacterium]MBT7041979.1 HDIG domain-containing protein [Candidatus Neomarinimicrobiota bacterium]MBT7515809.1 HDIG domain-containing protein [Candidatus Neomarinimicrobiota bacterium]